MVEQSNRSPDVWSSRAKVAFLVFAAIGAFFLIAEHRAHVLPYWPWLLLAACPLMHLFMHGGHGGHGGHHSGGGGANAGDPGESEPGTKPQGSWRGGTPSRNDNHPHHGDPS
jgi:hypothetical protein